MRKSSILKRRNAMKGSRVIKVFCIVAMLSTPFFQECSAEAREDSRNRTGHDRGWEKKPHHVYHTAHYIPRGRHVYSLPHGHRRFFYRGIEYYFWEGMFYRLLFGRYEVVPAPVGVIVAEIPTGCQPVVVAGTAYYSVNDVTYVSTSSGYKVVPEPKVVVIDKAEIRAEANREMALNEKAQATAQAKTAVQSIFTTSSEGSFTVNVPNSQGSYTAVEIRKAAGGYIGPQGEFYADFPKVEQLKAMYAK